jgi:hypothetical protein
MATHRNAIHYLTEKFITVDNCKSPLTITINRNDNTFFFVCPCTTEPTVKSFFFRSICPCKFARKSLVLSWNAPFSTSDLLIPEVFRRYLSIFQSAERYQYNLIKISFDLMLVFLFCFFASFFLPLTLRWLIYLALSKE